MISTSEEETEQLIQNLFISAECKNREFNQKCSLIVSPDFIKILLKDATAWGKEKKVGLVKRIASFYKAEPLNSLILGERDSETNSTLHEIVGFVMRVLQEHSEIPLFISIIKSFLTYYSLTYNHFKQLTQAIGRDYHMEKLSWVRLEMVILTLKAYYQSRSLQKQEPLGFFYFYGEESGIKVKCSQARWPFNQALGFMCCFQLRKSPPNHKSYLFHVETSSEQSIGVYVQNETLYFQLNDKSVNLVQLKLFTWYPVQFQYNLEHGRVYIALHDTIIQKQNLSIMPIDPSRTITTFIIGKNFYGKLNSPIVFAGPVPKDEGFRTNPYGFETWESITQAKQRNLLAGSLFGYFTFSMTQTHQKLLCFDPFRKCHGELMSNSSFFSNRYHSKSIGMLGGLRILLPLFHLGQFYSTNNHLNIIELLIDLSLTPFKLKFVDLERDSNSSNFFFIMGYLISQYDPKYLSYRLIEQLKEFKATIRQPKLKQEFWTKIVWRIPAYKLKDPASISLFYSMILESYEKNISFYEDSYPLSSVLYYTMLNLEDIANNCCPQHHLNQSILTPLLIPIHVQQSRSLHLKQIKPIIQLILSANLKNNYKRGLEQVKLLLRLFLNKASACFYLTMLGVLKVVLKMEEEKSQEAAVIIKECNILPFLFHLADKTINPDVIASIIDILLYLQTEFPNTIDQDRVGYFIASLFKKFPSSNSLDKDDPIKPRKKSESALKSTQLIQQLQPLLPPPSPRSKLTPQTISSSLLIYSTIKKYYYGKSFKQDPTPLIVNQQAIRLAISYYLIASKQIQEVILVDFFSQLTFSQHNLSFLSSSLIFTSFICCDILNKQISTKPITYQLATKIAVKIVEEKIRNKKLKQFYVILRAVVQYNKIGNNILYVVLIEFMKRLTKKSVDMVEALTQVGLIIFFELKRTIRGDYKSADPFFKMVDGYLSMVYEECLNRFRLIEQDDFEQKFFPNILQQPSTSPLLAFFTTEFIEPNSNKQQEMYIVFDNLLSKCQFDSKIQIQPILKKHLYTVQILFELLKVSIQRTLEQDNFHVEYYLNIMIKSMVLFLCLLTNSDKQHIRLETNVLGRKILFQLLNFLFVMSKQPHHQEKFVKGRDTLMIFVFEYIDYLDRMLGRHTSMGSLIKRIQQLRKIRYNPYIVELFQFFLRNQYNKPLVTLESINQYTQSHHSNITKVLEGSFEWVFTRPVLKNLNQAIELKDEANVRKQVEIQINDKLEQLEFMVSTNNYGEIITESILSNFDSQNPKEEKVRIAYIDALERNLRKVAHTWRKLWNVLRIYHMPYATWMNQRETMEFKESKNNPLKNFRSKISKYLSKSGSRPILEAQVTEPVKILNQQKFPAQDQMMNLNTLPSRFPKPSLKKSPKLDIDKLSFKVIWIKQSVHIKGTLIIYEQYLIFSYQSVKQKDIHTSYSPFKLNIWQELYKKWYFVDIVNMVRKRYLLEHVALELVFSNYSSVLMAFDDIKSTARFIEEIGKIRKQMMGKEKELLQLNKVSFCTREFLWELPEENLVRSKATQEWVERKISTFNYLLKLNFIGERSYNDYSQYPVFPWIVQGTNTKSPQLRGLDRNMGSLGSNERTQLYKNKYKSSDPFAPTVPYFFGTHYSSPGVVFNYMIRILPFTDCAKQLQGGKFDHADRMFFSLESTWNSATKQMSDVRELIPQYFTLPEMFINLDSYRLGVMQNGQRVDDVDLPVWAANAYHFVIQFRQILESEEVSEKINDWIDLVFGYKQKGKEGESAMNIFYYLTYENSVNLRQVEDEVERNSSQAQIIHFGQTPSQLFQKPHPKRHLIKKQPLQLKCLNTFKLSAPQFGERVIGLSVNQTTIKILYRQHIVCYTKKQEICNNRLVTEFDFQRDKNGLYIINVDEVIVEYFFEGKFMIVGGYLDGSYRIYRTDHPTQLIGAGKTIGGGSISKIHITNDSDMILLGTTSGTLQILQLKYESHNFLKATTIHVEYLQHKINDISQNQGFFAISYGEMVNIYRITRSLQYLLFEQRKHQQVKFFRSFKNKIKVNGSAIVESPLFSLVLFDNLGLKCYSINGQLIATLQTSNSVHQISIVKDVYQHDIIVLYDDGKLLCVSTPDLRKLSYEEMKKEHVRGLHLLQGDTIRVLGIEHS